jgi:hypothetical protein
MVASITYIQSPLNSLQESNCDVTVIIKYLKSVTFSKDLLYLYMMMLAFILVTRLQHILFSAFIFRLTSLIALIKVSVFFFIAYVISLQIHISIRHKLMCPF